VLYFKIVNFRGRMGTPTTPKPIIIAHEVIKYSYTEIHQALYPIHHVLSTWSDLSTERGT